MAAPLNTNSQDFTSMTAALKFFQRAMLLDLECMIPAQIMAYDRKTNFATVKPMIMISTLDPKGGPVRRTSRVAIPNIPVLSLGAGGYHISFPIKPGDLGWLFAADRDTQLFLQNLQEQPAGVEGASHNFKDSIFVPDVLRQYAINGEDADYLVIQSTDGASRVSIRPDNIKITTPLNVTIDSPDTHITGNTQIDGTLTVNQAVLAKSNATIKGMTAAQGGLDSVSGSSSTVCTLPYTTTVGGVRVGGHTHPGVQPGSGSTGSMQ